MLNRQNLLKEVIRKIYSIKWYYNIKQITDQFELRNINYYFIGGSLRDAIISVLYKKSFYPVDIDIVVELQDYREFVDILHKINFHENTKIIKYPSFLTISIFVNNNRIDVSLPRKEKYNKWGVLPTVEFGSIKDDLYRRDFGINAIGIKYNCSYRKYEFLDIYDGLNDLLTKKVRILHSNSFLDDPTRIFRAVRFIAKLGFRLDKFTEKCLKEAVEKDVIYLISKNRLVSEFLNILKKGSNLKKCLRIFKKYKLLKYFNFLQDIFCSFQKNCSKLELDDKKYNLKLEDKFFIRLLYLLELTVGFIGIYQKDKINTLKKYMILLNITHSDREKIFIAAEILAGLRKFEHIDKIPWFDLYLKIYKRKIGKLYFTYKELEELGVPKNLLGKFMNYLVKSKIKKITKTEVQQILKNQNFLQFLLLLFV
ncbi:MAG: hypothetical protein N2643_03250 [Endomicrobia bacterium]|nr:hypothetical protein [Endomicrobiia bacterium]